MNGLAFYASLCVWAGSLILVVVISAGNHRREKALREQVEAYESDRRSVSAKLVSIMDRIGVARSLSIETQIAYTMMEEVVHKHGPADHEPISWRERRLLIADLRNRAADVVKRAKEEDKEQAMVEARALNAAATHFDGYPYRGWSYR